jgi:hypothetical protein
MKKILLSCGLAAMLLSNNAKAQLALENFNAAGIPANWVMINVDQKIPSASFTAAIINGLTANAWMKWLRTTGDSAMLTTSWFNPVGQADRWLITPSFTVNDPNTFLTWEDFTPDAQFADNMEVRIATNAGTTTADFGTSLYNAVASTNDFGMHGISLGAYNGQTVRIAFRNNSNDKFLLYLDNVQTQVVANALDAAASNVVIPKVSLGNVPVKFTISNNGNTAITSVAAQYTIDGGTPVTQTFSTNILPFGSTQLTFTTLAAPPAGSHTVEVTINTVNGSADATPGDNAANTGFAIATQQVLRNGLIEEFSSSTCPPCATFNATFDPLVVAQGANIPGSRFNVIKYQMNWPAPGNDRSYNAHGAARQAYYGVSGIPDHYTNGATGGAGNAAEITASKTAPSFVDITGTFVIHNNNYDVTYSVTPYFTVTNTYKIHVAAVQREFDLDPNDPSQTTSQTHFVFAMREMFPDGNGTTVNSFTAGTPVTGSWMAHPFAVGNVQQNNYEWWSSPYGNDIVIFVQDDATGEVLQSQVVHAQWPTDVPSIANDTKVKLFPNPATDHATLALNMQNGASVNVVITDAVGRVISNVTRELSAGTHNLNINTSNYAAGVYNVTIKTEKGSLTERLTIAK